MSTITAVSTIPSIYGRAGYATDRLSGWKTGARGWKGGGGGKKKPETCRMPIQQNCILDRQEPPLKISLKRSKSGWDWRKREGEEKGVGGKLIINDQHVPRQPTISNRVKIT